MEAPVDRGMAATSFRRERGGQGDRKPILRCRTRRSVGWWWNRIFVERVRAMDIVQLRQIVAPDKQAYRSRRSVGWCRSARPRSITRQCRDRRSGVDALLIVRFAQPDWQLVSGPDIHRIGCERPSLIASCLKRHRRFLGLRCRSSARC